MGLAHFLGLLIGVQNQAKMGILRRNDRTQKPGKGFGPNMAFLDGLTQFLSIETGMLCNRGISGRTYFVGLFIADIPAKTGATGNQILSLTIWAFDFLRGCASHDEESETNNSKLSVHGRLLGRGPIKFRYEPGEQE
jgi:hypothetical protein